jgi:hypothetical protein
VAAVEAVMVDIPVQVVGLEDLGLQQLFQLPQVQVM